MSPQKIKCDYILHEIFLLEEKMLLIDHLKDDMTEEETTKVLARLKMVDVYLWKLRDLVKIMVCGIQLKI